MLKGVEKYMKSTSKIFDEPGIYIHLIQNTPSIKSGKKSLFTRQPVKSQLYTLEDGKTCCSMEEALEWALVNKMSPLRKGQRLIPFWKEEDQ